MDNVLAFMWDFRFILMVIIGAIFWAVSDWKGFRTKIGDLMLAAKQQAKDGILKSGKEQEEWVVNMAMQMLPVGYQAFISEVRMRQIVKTAYDKAMDLIDNGKLDNSWQ